MSLGTFVCVHDELVTHPVRLSPEGGRERLQHPPPPTNTRVTIDTSIRLMLHFEMSRKRSGKLKPNKGRTVDVGEAAKYKYLAERT